MMKRALWHRLILVLLAFVPVTFRAAARDLALRYQDFGPAGTVIRQEDLADLNLHLVTFSNGVHLNLRPSSAEPGRFRLRLVFPINAAHASTAGWPHVAAYRIFVAHLGRHSHDEVFAMLVQHKVELELRVDHGTPAVSLQGPATSLPFALRLLTAWLSDGPADRPVPLQGALKYRPLLQDPFRLSLWQGLREASGNDSRLGTPVARATSSFYDGISLRSGTEFLEWAQEYMLGGPLEIGLVGDIDVDRTLADAATNLGALPARQPFPSPQRLLAITKKAAKAEEISPNFASQISMSCLLWPLAAAEEPGQTAAVAIASTVLRDALVRTVQQAFQKTIDPKIWIHRDPVQRDFAFVVMQNAFAPASSKGLTDAIVRTAAKMAEVGIPEAEVERVKGNLRQLRAAELADNAWWLDHVAWAAQTHPALLAEARSHLAALDATTVSEVNEAAKVFSAVLNTAVILKGTK